MKQPDSPQAPPSPDRAFVRLVLLALAAAGLVAVLLAGLVFVVAGPTAAGVWSVRCLIAPVSALDFALHSTTLIVAMACSLIVLSGLRAWSRERAVAAELRWAMRAARLPPPPRVARIAQDIGVLAHLDIVEATRPFAFVYGWWRPRICLSLALVARLSDEELAAVLYHEDWHRQRRDPLRLLLVRTLVAPFVVLPPVRHLADHVPLAAEIAADRYTVGCMGHRRWLASALLKTLDVAGSEAAFTDYADARILALCGEIAPCRTHSGVGRAATVLLVVEAILLTSIIGWGGFPVVSLTAVLHPIC